MTAHFRAAQSEAPASRIVTHSCLATFTDLQRWPVLVALFPGTPLRGQRALRELSIVTSLGQSRADIAADCCWRMFPRDSTEIPNKNSVCSYGKRERSTISLEEFWVDSALGNKAREKLCGRRQKNSVVTEPVPSQPGDQSVKP